MRRLRRDAGAVAALVALCLIVVGDGWQAAVQWKPDSLFYRSQVLRLQGVDKDEALSRVFEGPLAAPRRRSEAAIPPHERKVTNPEWVRYSSRFYERRWVVPAVAAALDPVWGARGLVGASLIGYILVAPLLFALLRLLFPVWTALLASAASLLLYPLRYWSGLPLTDSWGLAAECLALIAGLLVLTRGKWWLALWFPAVLLLSFARDATVVAVVGAIAAWAVRPARRSSLLVVSGVAASLPAPLLFGAPLREAMAYTLNDFRPPADASWGFVASHYLESARSLVEHNLTWMGDHPIDAVLMVGGVLLLPIVLRAAACVRAFLLGGAAAAVVYDLLVPNYTGFRLELVFVPFAAIGLAAAATFVEARFFRAWAARAPT